MQQAKVGELGIPEAIPIGQFSIDIDRALRRSNEMHDASLNWRSPSSDHDVRVAAWGQRRNSRLEITWRLWEFFLQWVWPYPRVNPPAHIVGGSLAEVFHVNLHFRRSFLPKLNLGMGEADVGPQFSHGVIAHGFDNLIGLLPAFRRLGDLPLHDVSLSSYRLQGRNRYSNATDSCKEQQDVRQVFGRKQTREVIVRVIFGAIFLYFGFFLLYRNNRRGWRFWLMNIFGWMLTGSGLGAFLLPVYYDCRYSEDCQYGGQPSHSRTIVLQKYLTTRYFCTTVMDMANVLDRDKQIAVIGALAEGSSIRSIERITGVHRDTIMRLGIKVGQGCAALLDEKMRNLPCRLLQFDEVWGFIGKKERHVRPDDDPQYGDVVDVLRD